MIIQPANRTNSVSEYYFSRKLREIDEMNRLGEKVISLGIGSPDMAPAYEVIHTLIHGAENPENHAYRVTKVSRNCEGLLQSGIKNITV